MSKSRSFFQLGRNIFCIGRNFAEHAKELGNAVPTDPVVFLKPTSSYLRNGSLRVPAGLEVHHEVELGVVIGSKCQNVSVADAMQHVAGYCLAIDCTARNLQDKAKKKGLPWTISKGLDTFCPVSDFVAKAPQHDTANMHLWLKVDGVERQRGCTSDMIFPVPVLVSHLSQLFTLEEGDVILTGTPKGVGPVSPGQVITAGIDELGVTLEVPVVAAPALPLQQKD